jgi:tRNA-5-taurinomethyluridine 2-sulfurtransferase
MAGFFRRQHVLLSLITTILIVENCNGLAGYQLLIPSSRKKRPNLFAVASSRDEPSALQEAIELVSMYYESLHSIEDIQKDLVRKGSSFVELRPSDKLEQNVLVSNTQKVPGCVANVYVRTVLMATDHAEEGQEENSRNRVMLQGTADAVLSRGLLALLASILSCGSVEQILQLPSYDVANRLGLRVALSPGRNDGLASMLRTVQDQIQELLVQSNSTSSSEEVASSTEATPLQSQHIFRKEIAVSGNVISAEAATSKPPSVALLLSGGVDSSVALNLLVQGGFNVTAFYLKIWLEDELSHLGECPWEDDYRMCVAVCSQAGVPLESISLQQAYKDRVISYTIRKAVEGWTPNPDVMCNSRVKFGCFYDAIATRDFDFVATGHYAQLVRDNDSGLVRLFRALDPVKDQSYFLCALTQDQLQRVLFPIGHLQKSAVRQLAEDLGLPNRHRRDSQGLCFLGKVKFEDFLGAYLGDRPGNIVDAATGQILGRHKGVWYHTVGQRKGIGKVLYPLATSRGPWYVVAKDPRHDIVFCSNQYDDEVFASSRSEFTVESIQWIAGNPPVLKVDDRLTMKTRHGPKLVTGSLTMIDSAGLAGDVKLDHKDSGLAPGQYVAFYVDDECLGGGVISESHWAKFLLEGKHGLNRLHDDFVDARTII